MGEPHPMGIMAEPLELLAALQALGTIDRVPTAPEEAEAQRRAGGRALWRLECAQHLAGAVEMQVLMAGGAAANAGHDHTAITRAGRELYGGAGAGDDATRVGVLMAMTHRLVDQVMLLTARLRRGDADDGLSPLVMPSLLVALGLQGLLKAAVDEGQGQEARPRAGLPEVVEQLRGAADVLETMTPSMPPTA
ncbi:MAG: hypothetical protein ABR540_05530 [Acidimicrobiales bacterium]